MGSNDKQIGGKHYKPKLNNVQHWDWACNLGYLEGNATKYIGRHDQKNGIVDIEKALHLIEKILEVHYDAKLHWGISKLVKKVPEETGEQIPREYVNPDCGNVGGADSARNSY